MPPAAPGPPRAGACRGAGRRNAYVGACRRGSRTAPRSARPASAPSTSLLRGHLLHRLAGEHRFGLRRDRVAAPVGALVVHLHQQPALPLPLADAGEGIAAVEFLAFEPDGRVPGGEVFLYRLDHETWRLAT